MSELERAGAQAGPGANELLLEHDFWGVAPVVNLQGFLRIVAALRARPQPTAAATAAAAAEATGRQWSRCPATVKLFDEFLHVYAAEFPEARQYEFERDDVRKQFLARYNVTGKRLLNWTKGTNRTKDELALRATDFIKHVGDWLQLVEGDGQHTTQSLMSYVFPVRRLPALCSTPARPASLPNISPSLACSASPGEVLGGCGAAQHAGPTQDHRARRERRHHRAARTLEGHREARREMDER